MIFTKLLPVAVVESAVAFCFDVPFKIFSPVQPPFSSLPSPPLGLLSSSIFCAPFYLPLSQPWSLVPGYHQGNDSEDEYCLTNLLKTFVTRINLAEQRRT